MIEFVSSFMVGVNQTLIGLPFDTLKVWIQNNNMKMLAKSQPLSCYYRGWKPEFGNAIISNCIIFPVHTYTLPYTNNSFISGFFSGIAVSPFVFSFRTFKIHKQMGRYSNPVLTVKHIFKGLGYVSTAGRESVGMCMYFGTYNYLKKKDFPTVISGGIAGMCNWGISYPIDVITSRQIAQKISIKDAITQGNIFKGYGVCVSRSMIVNGFSFLVYESVKKIFNHV